MRVALLSIVVGCAAAAHVNGALRAPWTTLAQETSDINTCYGEKKCPCIGLDDVDGNMMMTVNAKQVSYPLGLGHCDAHDNNRHDDCLTGATPGPNKGYCAQRWCYVDPCNCDIPKTPVVSGLLPTATYQGNPVYFSYATCGGVDEWTESQHKTACVNQKSAGDCQAQDKCAWNGQRCAGKEVMGQCKKKVHGFAVGKAACRCIGIAKLEGSIDVQLDGKTVKYPASYGSECKTWEDGTNPKCTGANPPKWCAEKFCFIDPEECTLAIPPKMSAYLPNAKNNGKPVYYSYNTCGSVDHFTKENNPNACVNKETEAECSKSDKCAWGFDTASKQTRCLGKDLAKARAPKSGSVAAAPLLAVAASVLLAVF